MLPSVAGQAFAKLYSFCFSNPIPSRLDDHLIRHIRQHDGSVADAHPGTDLHADGGRHAHAHQRPLADATRTTVIALGAAGSSQVPNAALKFFVRQFHAVYLRRYFQLRPGGETEYRRWLPVVAAARLSENIPELERWLVEQAQKGLQRS